MKRRAKIQILVCDGGIKERRKIETFDFTRIDSLVPLILGYSEYLQTCYEIAMNFEGLGCERDEDLEIMRKVAQLLGESRSVITWKEVPADKEEQDATSSRIHREASAVGNG